MLSLSLSLCCIASAAAQPPCNASLGDDGLAPTATNPCCTIANGPVLPAFPTLTTTTGVWFSSTNCQPPLSSNVSVTIGAPTSLACGVFAMTITVTPSPSGPAFSGTLLATYSSTWPERRLSNNFDGQVWRFLISGDVSFTSGTPDVLPEDQPPAPLVHLVGSIDYACMDDGSGNAGFAMRYDLHHLCDCFHHAPGGPRPAPSGGFHPNTDYHLVGPTPVTLTVTPTFPNPCAAAGASYQNGSIREFDPLVGRCFRESLLWNSAGGGANPMSNIDICNASPAVPTCACGGPGGLWLVPSFFSFRHDCGTQSGTVTITAGNPCSLSSGVIQRFVVRHPASGVVFPAGRDVFFWFLRGDLGALQGGLCNGQVVSTQKETLTGVTTVYTTPAVFRAFDFALNPAPPFLGGGLTVSQSDWMNHHQVLPSVAAPQSHAPMFGVPTVGTLVLSGLN